MHKSKTFQMLLTWFNNLTLITWSYAHFLQMHLKSFVKQKQETTLQEESLSLLCWYLPNLHHFLIIIRSNGKPLNWMNTSAETNNGFQQPTILPTLTTATLSTTQTTTKNALVTLPTALALWEVYLLSSFKKRSKLPSLSIKTPFNSHSLGTPNNNVVKSTIF